MKNPYELQKYPRQKLGSGIYFLFDGDDLIYIGVSNHIERRIGEHSAGKDWHKKNIEWTTYAYMAMAFKSRTERRYIEHQYIVKYRPLYNISLH